MVIGYDRRFLAPELAEAIAAAVHGCELEPLLTESPVPTPACSWAVVERKALGALVITASHNPAEWLGLKIKGPFGGSVEGDFTAAVERRLAAGGITVPIQRDTPRFDGRGEHLAGLRKKLNLQPLVAGLRAMNLKLIVDPMHGSAAGCVPELLGPEAEGWVEEIRSNRDPLFGGHPPEPLAPYLGELINAVKASTAAGTPAVGLVFDGDGDRIAAVDEHGRFCSTQLLMPLLIDHLARARQLPGAVVKTVSGSDLMRLVAEGQGREVLELAVGFKYIATEMLSGDVLIGGEESGVSASACTCPNGMPCLPRCWFWKPWWRVACHWGPASMPSRSVMEAPASTTVWICAWQTWKPVGAWKHCWLKRLPRRWRVWRCRR